MQECAELRKEHKQNQAKENQRRVSMAKNYRAELKVSSYLIQHYHACLSLHNAFATSDAFATSLCDIGLSGIHQEAQH